MRNASPGEAGRYSAQDLSVEYLEAREVSSADKPLASVIVENEPPERVSDAEGVIDDAISRARRFTPKQRPAHRRGRQHDATLRTPQSRVKEERGELLRGLPDRSRAITSPIRASALRGSQPSVTAQESEAIAPAVPIPSPPPAENPRPPRAAAITQPLASMDPPPSLPTPSLPTPTTNPRLGPLARRGTPARVASSAVTQRMPERTDYQPLPKDRAGFEAFMQQRAIEAKTASRSTLASSSGRVHWKDQETLLIQRSALLPTLPAARIGRRRIPLLPIVAVCALGLVGAVTMFLRRQAAEAVTVRAVPITSSSAAIQAAPVPTTLIATEPSGAELLLGGAVLGNTPVAVARPTSGEETYVIRMTGFEWQLVRISPQSGEAIRVTMRPLGQSPQPPSAAP